MIIINTINLLVLLWIVVRIHDLEKETKKTNKNSQEEKTRLSALRNNVNKIKKYFKIK